ncbi:MULTISPECIES: NmrA family NAD(P)-binding protein [unclassified Variovorax]|jgi:uncharacterized protein YbjT (DUF2867 family)|uniref:NAD-dependent epimerase/dehydratase family protein n=1 Tax=unclassified Variovorax TaxID=663243 RepID=UPI000F7E5109|nr:MULTISPECIES: NmrA family NAD(P)-binding protein [unclassified Variovorax]RSZ34510.1 epimerase [Variovorax sp. 553]RSZ35006.1 epimerase [Variovorax sp. 679]
MKVLIFGATGMVGQGVLRECLLAPDVESVVAVGRNPTGQQNPKLRDLVHKDMYDYGAIESQLQGFDACFFCLGVSSVGMKEPEYKRITYDLTLAAATVLARLNPGMTFTYVTGVGTDSSERGSSMWARVKGATENALLRLPFKAAYMFRPGMIQPLHGIRSKTPLYDAAIVVLKPLLGLAHSLWPNRVTTTEKIGRAMLAVARNGAPKPILDPADINALG